MKQGKRQPITLFRKTNKHLTTRSLGEKKEQAAWYFLKQKGFHLVEKNFFCRFGEVDLIVENKTEFIFVEVRYRLSSSHGGAASSITPSKQQKLIRSAEYYLQHHEIALKKNCRIDVIAIDNDNFEWIQNAIQR